MCIYIYIHIHMCDGGWSGAAGPVSKIVDFQLHFLMCLCIGFRRFFLHLQIRLTWSTNPLKSDPKSDLENFLLFSLKFRCFLMDLGLAGTSFLSCPSQWEKFNILTVCFYNGLLIDFSRFFCIVFC